MTLTNYQMFEALRAIREISGRDLPARISFALVKNARRFEDEMKDFEDARDKVAAKYAADDDDAKAAFTDEIQALLDTEVDVDVHTVPFSAIEAIEISPAALYALDFMIED